MVNVEQVRDWKSWSVIAACAFAPLAIFTLGKFLFVAVQACDLSFPYEAVGHGIVLADKGVALAAGEAGGRYVWLSSVLMIFCVSFVCLGYFVSRLRAAKTRKHVSGALWVAVSGIVIFAAVHYWLIGPTKNYECVGGHLFVDTIGSIELFGHYLRDYLQHAVSLSEGIAALAAVSISVGAAMLVRAPQNGEIEHEDELAEKFAILRNYLFLGAVLLVTGMMALRSFFYWPKSFIIGDAQQVYVEHINALLTYQGVIYVFMLAALFGLPHMVLARRARQLAEGTAKDPDGYSANRKWLLERGLSAKISDQITQFIAILSPFLAGPASGVLESVLP